MAFDLSMPILVVDDYSTMIRIIRNLLKQLGFENVDDASDGSAALAKMQAKKYGLVISDWNMEPMTGYDLLREVRASPELSKTPFIMITAESKTENVIAAKKAGVNNYIVKPFNAATLKTKIEAVFPDMASAYRRVRYPESNSRCPAWSGHFVLNCHSGAIRSIKLWCATAHLRSGPPDHPGMTARHNGINYQRSSRINARGGWPNSSLTEVGSS